ncbi:hypothetical protein [Waltera sp.]|uniref:hypothetical protein n=1 Tax=Waltera sp. TaxID=2815806 RepID=UPI003990DDB2
MIVIQISFQGGTIDSVFPQNSGILFQKGIDGDDKLMAAAGSSVAGSLEAVAPPWAQLYTCAPEKPLTTPGMEKLPV